jgi:hypothetical protein
MVDSVIVAFLPSFYSVAHKRDHERARHLGGIMRRDVRCSTSRKVLVDVPHVNGLYRTIVSRVLYREIPHERIVNKYGSVRLEFLPRSVQR